MLGLEQALSVVVETMVETGLLDWHGVADRMSVRPAAIGRLDGHGRPLAPGEPANLLLLDPTARATVDPAALASRSRNSPYAGRELPGRVVATFLRGDADRARRKGDSVERGDPRARGRDGRSGARPTARSGRRSARRCSPPA